jgi:hypothetical protein
MELAISDAASAYLRAASHSPRRPCMSESRSRMYSRSSTSMAPAVWSSSSRRALVNSSAAPETSPSYASSPAAIGKTDANPTWSPTAS